MTGKRQSQIQHLFDHLLIFASAQFGGITLGLSIGGAVFINCAQNALKALFPDVDDATLQQAISGKFHSLEGEWRAKTNLRMNIHDD